MGGRGDGGSEMRRRDGEKSECCTPELTARVCRGQWLGVCTHVPPTSLLCGPRVTPGLAAKKISVTWQLGPKQAKSRPWVVWR